MEMLKGPTFYTTKDMAELCNVSIRTVQTIIRSNEIDFVIKQGTKAGGNLYDENALKLIQIKIAENQLKQGRNSATGSKAVEAITKAEITELLNAQNEKFEVILKSVIQSIPEVVKTTLDAIGYTPKAPALSDAYYTVLGYANINHLLLTNADAVRIGMMAKKLSLEEGKEIKKVPDTRFGFVNSYHISILNKTMEAQIG